MQELLNKLKELSNKYEKLSNALGLNDDCEEKFFNDCDEAINEGKSQAYWRAHIDLDKIIKEYD